MTAHMHVTEAHDRMFAELTSEQRDLLLAKLREKAASRAVQQAQSSSITPVTRDEPIPLSFAQQRLWFLHQMNPTSPIYNLPNAVRLKGRLDIKALERTLTEIVRRHESLRTTFAVVDGLPVQIFSPARQQHLPIIDLSEMPERARGEEERRIVAAECERPFDLSNGPLLRVTLVRAGQDDHILILVMHHIASDAWSSGVLVREVVALYEAFYYGNPSPLAEPAIQYADYAYWQRQWLQGQVLETQLDYWKQKLQAAAPLLELPTDRPRSSIITFNGDTVPLAFPHVVAEAVKELARNEEVTLFMTLLAAFKTLLYRLTGQEDIVVGTPIAGRNRLETEGLIGFFVNALALRTEVSGEMSFRGLLKSVRETTLEAFTHQDLPFEKLVEEIQPERRLSHTPLFQVVFSLQNVSAERLQLPGLSLSPLGGGADTAKFDITLFIGESPEGLVGSINYNSDLFDRSSIESMVRQFETLLESIVADPEQPISRLAVMTRQEKLGLLERFGGDAAEYAAAECLHEAFEKQVERTPDAVAILFNNERLTYSELNGRANRLAHHLKNLGVGPESLVAICLERSIEMVVGILGILKAGGAYVPLDPAYPRQRLSYIIDDTGARVLLTQQNILESLPDFGGDLVLMDAASDEIARLSSENPAGSASPENAAYVIYTSGSTGMPKGVLVTHYNVDRLIRATDSWFHFGERDAWTLFHSYAFDFSVWELWGALLRGGRLVVVPHWVSRSPEAFYSLLVENRVTVLNQTPSAFRQLIQADKSAGDDNRLALRLVIFGGEALELQCLKPWFERHGDETPRMVNMYGITETTVHVTYRVVTMSDVIEGAGSVIGEPIPDLQIYLLDEHLEPVPTTSPGEMYVGGCGLARGYLNRPELTAERFIPNPYSKEPGARLYRSGDLAKHLAGRDLRYLGRADNQVKIRGFRIEVGEIEAVLRAHPAIDDCAVVALEGEDGQRRLAGYIVARQGEDLTVEGLRGYLKERVPDYMVVSSFMLLDALPLTSNGKLNRKALPAPDQSRPELGEDYAAPSNEKEELLASIWSRVLGVDRVGINDNYFALGGDSIRSIQVRARAQEVGLDVSLQQLFQHQTIKELAQVVTYGQAAPSMISQPFSLISDEDRDRVPDYVEDAYPLAFLQAGMLFHAELDSDQAVFHDVFSYHLLAPLDEQALRLALERMIDKHAVLRTSFDLTGYSQPLQLVHRKLDIPLSFEDLRDLTFPEQDQTIRAWVETEKKKRFNWEQPPLFSLHVHRRSDEHFQFTLSFHHAILDGWSVASMLTELFQDYLSLLSGVSLNEDDPLAATFRDFVALEQASLNSTEARQFWLDLLQESAMARLPRRMTPRPVSDDAVVRSVNVPISIEVSEGLKELARAASVPIRTVLMAAHLRVISFLSGRADVTTGVGFNGRPETTGGERVLGLFLNTLPFRLKLDGGTWSDIVKAAFDLEREMLPHRRYPMPRLKEETGSEALFETAFNFIHFHVYQNLRDLSGEVKVLDRIAFEKTDMTLVANFNIDLVSSQVGLSLSANPAEISDELAEAMRGYYQKALEAMAFRPLESYDATDLLSDEERKKITVEWNDTRAEFAGRACFHDLFQTQATLSPDAPAVCCRGQVLSYGELDLLSNQLANRLVKLGVGPEVTAAVFVPRSAELLIAILAVAKAGGAYLPIETSLPAERVAYMLEDSGARVVITEQRLEHLLPASGAEVVRLDSFWEYLDEESATRPAVEPSPDNLAYIIYTSGTTGRPKGVMVTHGGLTNYLMWAADAYYGSGAEAGLVHTSAGFDLTVTTLLCPLVCGKRVEVVSEEEGLDGLVDRLKGRGGELVVKLTPAHMEVVNQRLGEEDSGAWNVAVVGGEALRQEVVRRWKSREPAGRVINEYGPTETVVGCSVHEVSVAEEERSERGDVAIGRPIANARMYVVDSRMGIAPVGVEGEIYIGGAGVGRGYVGKAEETADRFVPDEWGGEPGARLYRTGDRGRYREDGEIEYLGRRDGQVKVRGYRIELGEVEAVLREESGVDEAVVLVRGEEEWDKRLVGYVVRAEGEQKDWVEVRERMRRRLPEYMIPVEVVEVGAMPLTANGKIDRRALLALGGSANLVGARYVAPRTPLERTLAEIWQQVLRQDRIGVHDNFFERGGHSLTAIQAFSRINKKCDARITLRDFFASPTIAQLADVIDSTHSPARAEIEPLPRQDYYDLSHAQKRLWIVCQSKEASVAYNDSGAYLIEGDLDVEALKQAFASLIDRHESLRTSFVVVEGEAKQKIDSAIGFDINLIDLCADENREERAMKLARGETQLPFDLQRGPLIRTKLIKLEEAKYLFLLTIHHIISDAWSMRVMVNDLLTFYDCHSKGTDSPLKPLRIQYKDYAAWEKQQLAGERLEEHRQYWLTNLGGELPTLNMPTDYPRPAVQTFNGDAYAFLIDEDLTAGLYSLGKATASSLFMCLLASIYALLYRHTGQQDIIVASPITGRDSEDLEDQIGFYLNTLALRVMVSGGDSARALIRKVKLTTLHAFQHQIYPFDWLVKELGIKRDPSRTPLMDVAVSLQNNQSAGRGGDGSGGAGFSITPVAQENRITKNDLWFAFTESDGRIGGAIHYNTDLFKPETIEMMALGLKKLISGIVSDCEIRVIDIELSEEDSTEGQLPEVDIALNFDLSA